MAKKKKKGKKDKKKHTITMADRMKAVRKVMREITHMVKPMITTDKKKQKNKNESRAYRQKGKKGDE